MPHNRTVNMRVSEAGYKYIGHYRQGRIEIILEGSGCGVSVQPKNEFDLFDLFLCFGLDPEDGKWLHEIVGRYCRVTFDDTGRARMIQHIVNDKPCWINALPKG